MHERRHGLFPILRGALGTALLATLPAHAWAQGGAEVREADLAALGKGLLEARAARESGLGVDEARSAVVERLARLSAASGVDPLRRPDWLARALRLARERDPARLEKGKVGTDVFAQGSFALGPGLEVAYRLPRDYDPEREDYPLILAIPDRDERAADHVRSHWTSKDLRERAIVVSFAMPAAAEGPQALAGWEQVMVRGRPGGLAHVMSALRFATERFAVDPDRIYVAGRGAGVPAALAAGNYGPQRFAGVIGRSGDASDLAPDNFANLPTCFAAGGERAEAFALAANGSRAAALGDDERCTLLASDDEALVWSWIQEHPRLTYPPRVRLVTGDPFPTRVSWLRVAPSAPGANATAAIERSTNTITITTEGVSDVTLYLNDALVDLDRPLRVVCNGNEETRQLERRLASLLDLLFDGTSDAGVPYVAQATFVTGGAAQVDGDDREPWEDAPYLERLAQAESSAELWSVHEWCLSTERPRAATATLRRIVRLEPDQAAAREALGQHGADGQWFASREALERFLRGQVEAGAVDRGLVQSRGRWIHPDERSLASKGWEKDFASGQWLQRSDLRRLAEGWARQDLEWIPPAEAGNVDLGLWLVDGEWVDPTTADRRHARLDSMWRIPCGDVWLRTTLDRSVALRAAEHMGRAIEDLQRVFGAQPVLPLAVTMLRDEEQYDRFAFGDPDGRRPPTHTGRLHTIHSAFFAESWFEPVEGRPTFAGTGVGYWESGVPNGDLYGVHAARLAVGLSWVEALDPSPKAVRKALSRGLWSGYYEAFEEEKRLPAWLRAGGAVYGERYFKDDGVSAEGDPWWARRWSLDNLARLGGLRELDVVLAFALDPEEREDGQRLLLEAGLLVAFLVDGDCAPVHEAHEAVRRALVAGSLHPKHLRALEEALRAHEPELRAFAGI